MSAKKLRIPFHCPRCGKLHMTVTSLRRKTFKCECPCNGVISFSNGCVRDRTTLNMDITLHDIFRPWNQE